jgi:hypothetical protein
VPDDAVPDDAVPDDAVPDDAVPDDAVPDDAVPDDTVPDDAVPDDAVPDDRATISDCDLGPDLGQKLDSDTTDLAQLLDRGEPAVCGAPVQDPL